MLETHATTQLWLIRHAPVQKHNHYGQVDVPCKSINVVTTMTLVSYLPDKAIVICSPLHRVYKTLRELIVAGWCGVSKILIEPSFTEQNFGSLEGITQSAVWNIKFPTFWTAPFLLRPQRCGENFLDVITRVQVAVKQLLYNCRDQNIVILAHAGPIRAILEFSLIVSIQRIHLLSINQLSISCLKNKNELWTILRPVSLSNCYL